MSLLLVHHRGAGTGDAKLSIYVPGGRAHDPWTTYGAPRLMQPALDVDFQVEVRIDSVVADVQIGGMEFIELPSRLRQAPLRCPSEGEK